MVTVKTKGVGRGGGDLMENYHIEWEICSI